MHGSTRRAKHDDSYGDKACAPPATLSDALPVEGIVADRKTWMMCEQARRALELALAGECRDPALRDLVVLGVLPDPGPRRLRVWLGASPEIAEHDRSAVLERLRVARGFLRSEVAAAIRRKRVPELTFELLGGAERAEGMPR